MAKTKKKPNKESGKQVGKSKQLSGEMKSKRGDKVKKTKQVDHFEHIPFKLQEIMKSKDRMKNALVAGKKFKGSLFPVNKPEPSKYEDIPVPHFKRKKMETEKRFLQRMESATRHVLFLTKNQVERKPELAEDKQEKPANQGKSEKKKQYGKARMEKLQQKKLERHEDDMEKDLFHDEVAFGEVSMEPPQLTSKPKKAPIKSQKSSKDLLLNSLLGHSVSSGAKPSMARQRIVEEERVRAVEAYRLLKKQKLQQQETQKHVQKKLEAQE
ncbi:coiled-coil domain-containing protein 137 [Neosynchiropus ocellatus]